MKDQLLAVAAALPEALRVHRELVDEAIVSDLSEKIYDLFGEACASDSNAQAAMAMVLATVVYDMDETQAMLVTAVFTYDVLSLRKKILAMEVN